MHAYAILATAFAALAAASPVEQRSTYHGISLFVDAAKQGQTPVLEPAPVEINVLGVLHGKGSAVTFDKSVHPNVNLNTIECRLYSDHAGLVPLGAAFTAKDGGVVLGTNQVKLGSVLCYVAEELS